MTSRRDFMAQCLGGLGIAVVGGVPELAAKSPKKITDIRVEGFENKAEPPDAWFGPKLRVETDLTPLNTKLKYHDGRNLTFVDELLVQWFPRTGRSVGKSTTIGQDMAWVGVGFISLSPSDIKVDNAIMPQIAWGEPNLNSDILPFMSTQDGKPLPLHLAKCERDNVACLSRGFGIGFLPVKITKELNDHTVQFMQCGCCSRYDRALDIQQDGWSINTAQRSCPYCGHGGRQQVDLGQELVPWKLHMTPQTSILVCQDVQDGDNRPTPQLFPNDLDLGNRPMWMAKEAEKHAMAQIVPDPCPLNDLFLSAFAPLFGGVRR